MKNLYILKSIKDDRFIYKIGFTKRSVESRIKDFKTGNTNDIDIIYTFRSDYVVTIENLLHKHYEYVRVPKSKEWFYLTDEDLEHLPHLYNKYYLMVKELDTNNTNGFKYK